MTQLPVRSPIFTDPGAAMFAILSLLLGVVKVSVGSIEVGKALLVDRVRGAGKQGCR